MILFRKIEDWRWFGRKPLESLSVSDLSNKDNELSVWMDTGASELDLALAFSLTCKSIKGLYWAKIPEDKITKKGLKLRQQDSSTPYVALRKNHTNIVIPTLFEMGDVAEVIHSLTHDVQVNFNFIPEVLIKDHFYDKLVEGEIEIDFSIKDNQNKWEVIKKLEKEKGKIDYTKLKNVKPGR